MTKKVIISMVLVLISFVFLNSFPIIFSFSFIGIIYLFKDEINSCWNELKRLIESLCNNEHYYVTDYNLEMYTKKSKEIYFKMLCFIITSALIMYLIFCSIMGQFNPEWIGGIEVHVPFAYAVSFLLLICPSLFFPRFFNIAIYFMVVLYLSYGGRDMLQSIRLVIILSLIWYILLTLANSVYSIKRLLGDRKIYERLLKIIATLISLFLSNKLGGWLESKGIRQVLEEIWTQYTLAFIAINYLSLSFFEIKVYQSKKKS